jgi:thiamine kinase-like enzyme
VSEPLDPAVLDPAVLATCFARVPALRGADPTTAVRLGGLTNRNYLIGDFVVRIPGDGTSEYIDRAAEEVAARSAAHAGVNAPVEHFDPDDGFMVTRFVRGAVTMDPARFAADLGAVARAGEALRRLHTTAAPFATEFRLFAMIDEYRSLLAQKGAPLPDGYAELVGRAADTRRALASARVVLVPSHCDPLCENFLDLGDRMYLIDYEYAGNNDPMWDLADLSVEGGFSAVQDEALLQAYSGGTPSAADLGRMVALKAMCDLLWTLWGVIQHVNANPAEDFWAYALGRFERCRDLMTEPGYADALAAI